MIQRSKNHTKIHDAYWGDLHVPCKNSQVYRLRFSLGKINRLTRNSKTRSTDTERNFIHVLSYLNSSSFVYIRLG